jgi:hypothetical protein
VLRSSLTNYTRTGWLNRVAHGLYQRPETLSASPILPADWRACLLAARFGDPIGSFLLGLHDATPDFGLIGLP